MTLHKRAGFTLIEILLVVVIIGVMLAVIVPRAWRANTDAKYALVRQAATELASFANQWVEENMRSQTEYSEAQALSYYRTLVGNPGNSEIHGAWYHGDWVATTSASNWQGPSNKLPVWGRNAVRPVGATPPGGTAADPPDTVVEQLVPPEKVPRNPFNGANVFNTTANYPSVARGPIPGALCCAAYRENNLNFVNFALLFQGTDSTRGYNSYIYSNNNPGLFHAGQDITMEGVRNGVFMARVH